MRNRGRVSTAFVGVLAAIAIAMVAAGVASRPPVVPVCLLAGLRLLLDWHPSSLWHSRVILTLGAVILLAAIPIVGTGGAVLVALTGAMEVESRSLLKRVFNAAQLVIAVGLAGVTYAALNGPVFQLGPADFPDVIGPALAADVVFCVVNAALLSTVISISSGVSAWGFLRGVLQPQAPAYLAYGLFGLLFATLWLGNLGPIAALLLISPLFIARWVLAQYAAEQDAYEATVRSLVQAVETKDLYTRGHSERVAHGSVMIARVTGMREDRVESLRYAGLLHDLGKIGVATRILHKIGRLDEAEFAAVRLHPERGVEMVQEIEFLDEARAGIMHHHERMDGRGYPSGLRGDAIPEFARVIAVADAFDAMTTVRSYRGARSIAEATRELRKASGSQFDPDMVRAFLAALERDGWQVPAPPEVPQAPEGRPVPVFATDHDDPTLVMPPRGPGGIR